MQIPKPTATDIERFRSLVPGGAEVKPMFGNLGAFVHGNMFMGLLGADIGLKLGVEEGGRLRATPGAGPFGPPERPMGGWVTLPSSLIGTAEGARWVELARAYAEALPPKTSKRGG